CRALARPFVTGGVLVDASASVGVAIHDAGVEAADLLAIADTAMYEAKRAGRNTWRLGCAPMTGAGAGGEPQSLPLAALS
ncbi:diguanylate cyclase, partial [Paraburkholderia sp. Ac-20347]|uniref:diguanylate cyclase domain-containing protein n=1 Tax=Paraburkholderia sp. Ac-20347 TaxID=2703892 RepID=UPI0019806CA2